MNYYIQGDAAKADQIRAAFKRLGINVLDFGFADKTVVYCSIGECVQYLPYSINLMNILYSHPDYQELELPTKPKFKAGDWITNDAWTHCIQSISDGFYHFLEGGRLDFGKIDGYYRLWTIADAKYGDVLVCYSEAKGGPIEQAGIFKQYVGRHGGCSNAFLAHTGIDWDGNIIINGYMGSTNILPATKEQRDMFFKKMREAGYEWDEKKKELRKIIKPKFKVGDKIQAKDTKMYVYTVLSVDLQNQKYIIEHDYQHQILFTKQDNFELVPKKHYDIANFKPFDKVLIRVGNKSKWTCDFFSYYHEGFHCIGTDDWSQCIPFKGNEHLLGTADMCDERFINW